MRAIDSDVDSPNDVVDTLFVDSDDLLPQDDFTIPVTYMSFLGYFTTTLSFRLSCKYSYKCVIKEVERSVSIAV